MAVQNKVHLITYPDSMGGNLQALGNLLQEHFQGLFAGIHILPPYPSSGDRGFAPLTYDEIDPAFGSWEDVHRLSKNYDIALDYMVNHLSARSAYFQDFLEKGGDSPYADLFITFDKIWPDGQPREDDLSKIFLRRPRPYSVFPIGKEKQPTAVWTTFGGGDPSEQIDLDVHSPAARELLTRTFAHFSEHHVRMIRLDAIGYVIKKAGSSCFFLEPEIYRFIDWVAELAGSYGIEVLPEVHADFETCRRLSRNGQWTYDFVLPYLVLETLVNRSSAGLYRYLGMRPQKLFTTLDCHDGVPLKPDVDGLYDSASARKVVEHCRRNGAKFSLILSDEHKDPDGFDVHQIAGTYYSLLGCDDDAYIAARAIQFFVPGVPQVYYVGLLAGENDAEQERLTGDVRELNRHNYTSQEVALAADRPVVQRLKRLIALRSEHPAFGGSFSCPDVSGDTVCLCWENGDSRCRLYLDLTSYRCSVTCTGPDGQESNWIA